MFDESATEQEVSTVTQIPSLASEVKLRGRFFDPFRAPKSDAARGIVDDVIRQVQDYEDHFELRKRSRKPLDQEIFEATITAIICDAIYAYLDDKSDRVLVSLSKEKLARRSRYRSPALSKTLPAILKCLSSPEMDLIKFTKGFREEVRESFESDPIHRGQLTQIEAGPKLVS